MKTTRITTLLLLTVCVVLTNCKKRTYPQDIIHPGAEGLYMNGSVNDEPVQLRAGSDGYYCYSSYSYGSDSVYRFEGELRKFNCNPCSVAMKLELSDFVRRGPGNSINPDLSFARGVRDLQTGASKVSSTEIRYVSNKQIASATWKLSDGTISEDSVLKYEFLKPGVQTVTLIAKTTQNSGNLITCKVVNGTEGLFACFSLPVSQPGNAVVFNSQVVGGRAPFSYQWNFGDGKFSSLEAPQHNYLYGGSYPVKLTVTDADNKKCEINFIYVTANDLSSCALNFRIVQTGIREQIFNGANIQWTDVHGTVFRSDKAEQTQESYFEIIDSKNYEPNEKGESGRLLAIRFNVLVSDGERQLRFKSEKTEIVVAYK